jgi:hypothetical protein
MAKPEATLSEKHYQAVEALKETTLRELDDLATEARLATECLLKLIDETKKILKGL